ncbi:MAG: hypothetical protein JRJ09_18835 [Deltaproteobacteria bacterium]|nr:hypothetical protein [Deltaproteobacteria bacterium]
MKLKDARVCIGCDEIFDQGYQCPVCGRDDNWVRLTSWIPAMAPGTVVVSDGDLEVLQRMAGLKE